MKVFKLNGTGRYCGGMAIVSAETQEEALKVLYDNRKTSHFCINYNVIEELHDIRSLKNEAKVIAIYELGE